MHYLSQQMARPVPIMQKKIRSRACECAIADFMALIRTTARATGNDEYDVRAASPPKAA